MAFTNTELDALKAAYATGVVEVEYDGKKTRYDSGAAILRRIRVIEAEIAAAAGAPRNMSTYATFNRG
jgi:hypothetical protein